ncbi:MAG: 6-phosphofructokinase [Actinomycetaceae bacterium]|nr:6-phosphofructokinase [Actinomycetaceae bacterium]
MVTSSAASKKFKTKLGVLTSGGDAQGMNAAVRAVVRTALKMGAQPYAILEGWAGAVEGGNKIKPMKWADVSVVLNRGGTTIGTARCPEFRERDGMRTAAKHLVEQGIDRLIVIGGDGSLSGTEEFKGLWPELLKELVEREELSVETAQKHPALMVAGLVGSIDNDLVGSDMTIGTDSALHRILTAIDELSSTAASHQRTFVVEVMGRRCGYLPLMSAVAGGCDYVFIPEMPPACGWEQKLAERLRRGRKAGRRDSLVLVAEGATDRDGNRITAQRVADALEEEMGEAPRITILGHVQRGGTPSAYDRWMSTALGYAAVHEVLNQTTDDESFILGVRHNRIARLPLVETVKQTRAIAELVANKQYEQAVRARGKSFQQMYDVYRTMAIPPEYRDIKKRNQRIGILHVGGLAPGMNTAARAAVRVGIARGFTMVGIKDSFGGLMDGKVKELHWEDVEGWGFDGGAELGTRRAIPTIDQFYAIGRSIENHGIDALLLIGGFNAYLSAQEMVSERDRFPAFNIPMMCIPTSIDNNLPGSELSIGADSALNNAVWSLDRIKESAAASTRCFVADTMGRHCGYLALMAGIAAGAEFVYLDEDNTTLQDIANDAAMMTASFEEGRRLCLVVRNEEAGGRYNREFMARVFEEESRGRYDVRHSALGHLQQGGEPSPFDRLLATRMVDEAIEDLETTLDEGRIDARFIGLTAKDLEAQDLSVMNKQLDKTKRRPLQQWWMCMKPLIIATSRPEQIIDLPQLPLYDTNGDNKSTE